MIVGGRPASEASALAAAFVGASGEEATAVPPTIAIVIPPSAPPMRLRREDMSREDMSRSDRGGVMS
ncbi:hypothetical protein GCM10007979_26800 [Nocardioides albus]|nr:hypothetical protein GCM10007979_26800 [Nocardioides albus]